MVVGELIEYLIGIKDSYPLMRCETRAINETCNILEKLPLLVESGKVLSDDE